MKPKGWTKLAVRGVTKERVDRVKKIMSSTTPGAYITDDAAVTWILDQLNAVGVHV